MLDLNEMEDNRQNCGLAWTGSFVDLSSAATYNEVNLAS
jgi:hypothetical protein